MKIDSLSQPCINIVCIDFFCRCNRYPKPPKLTSESANNSLPNDMWRAFLAETGADLTITCERYHPYIT